MLGSWLLLRWMLRQIDPNRKSAEAARARRRELSRRLGRVVETDGPYEDTIAAEVVNPALLDVGGLSDVGGLDDIVADVRRHVLVPLQRPDLFKTSLLRSAKGVLLYGPPGTGKTLLAKAIARESGACFISLRASVLLSKWFGDTNRLVAAAWSLARKLAPCVIFLDEVDALLGSRRAADHEASTALKTEFMQLWDGFQSSAYDKPVLVLGATNRREDLDDAVLRRFSLQYEVPLPTLAQRRRILGIALARHAQEVGPDALDADLEREVDVVAAEGKASRELARTKAAGGNANAAAPTASSASSSSAAPAASSLSLPTRVSATSPASALSGLPAAKVVALAPTMAPFLTALAAKTEGYSGSDLNEVCSRAATMPLHDAAEALEEEKPLGAEHLERALAAVQPPSQAARQAAAGADGLSDEERIALIARGFAATFARGGR